MDSAEKALRELIDRHLPSPSHMEMAAAHDGVLDRLRSKPAHLQKARIADSEPLVSRRSPVMSAAAAAAVLAAVVGTSIFWSGGDTALYRVVDGTVQSGDTIRTNGGGGAMLALADGSRVEMRSQSELSLERADDGVRIRLGTGGIIVNAAKQRRGHLHVQTKDMTVSVVGTVFMVDAGEEGSRVAVIEGEVRVREGATETKLRPGDHVSTNPDRQPLPVKEEIAWSRQTDTHLALLQQSVPQNPRQAADGPAAATAAQATTLRPQFEEASIRPCSQLNAAPSGGRGGGSNGLVMTPGHLFAECMTVATLIRTAYGYHPMELESTAPGDLGMRFGSVYGLGVEDGKRVRGGPDWVRSDKYSIEAVGDGAASAQTMQGPMLQELLERRFQASVHIEAEQVPAFALAVASSGLKIKPMEEGACSREGNSETVKAERARWGWNGPVLFTEAARLGIKPTCGTMRGGPNGPNYRFEHVAQTPGSIAAALGFALDARVVDRTGVTDTFIFGWEFEPDDNVRHAMRELFAESTGVPRPGWDGPSTLPKAPSIFTALEQQLGLKLEPIRIPREFIVIDRVERPSPN